MLVIVIINYSILQGWFDILALRHVVVFPRISLIGTHKQGR